MPTGGYGGAPTFGNVLGNAASGAAAGASFGPVGAAIGAGISLVPSIYKLFAGNKQRNQGMKPLTDPGYQTNTGVIQNRDILAGQYGNYQMPGYSRTYNQIGAAYGNAFEQGVQGASSSNDVLDLATRLAYGQSTALADLEARGAAGKEQALGNFLQGNAAAGQEGVNRNAYDREIYQGQLRENAANRQAGNENIYGALDTLGTVAGAYLNPKKYVTTGNTFTPEQQAAIEMYKKQNGL